MNWYMTAIKKYATFNGRSRRKEYWYFCLFNILICMAVQIFDAFIGTVFFTLIYSLALLIPSIALGVRRLHDTGRTGWWLLIALIPLIGSLALLYFMVSNGDSGSNKYGDDPKILSV